MRKRAALALLLAGCAPSHAHLTIVRTGGALPIPSPHHEPIVEEYPTTSTTSTSEAPTEAPKPVYVPPGTEAPKQVYVAPEPTYAPAPPPQQVSGYQVVSSTEYCDHGTTADGEQAGKTPGGAAMNGVPFGSRWQVEETGATYYVNDRIGSGSDFDIWTSSCSAAMAYGRQTIHIRRVA